MPARHDPLGTSNTPPWSHRGQHLNPNSVEDHEMIGIYNEVGRLFLYQALCCSTHNVQITWPAVEQNDNECTAYKMLVGGHYEAHQLIFVDMSHFNWMTMRHPFAWAPRGDHAHCCEFFVHGTRLSRMRIFPPIISHVIPRAWSHMFKSHDQSRDLTSQSHHVTNTWPWEHSSILAIRMCVLWLGRIP